MNGILVEHRYDHSTGVASIPTSFIQYAAKMLHYEEP